jgi:hypothetical protein
MRDQAERMGGRLRLRSAPRRGTEMEFFLPVALAGRAPIVASMAGVSVSNIRS